jgi:hypothetical protein
MPPTAVATPKILTNAGYLFITATTTAIPTFAATASLFSDTWPVAWLPLGATEDGSTFSYETNVEPVTVAEFFDPIQQSTTSRQGSFSFNLASYTLSNLLRAFNQGPGTATGIATPDSGTGATAVYSAGPPTPGNEVRVQLGWESLDNTMRLLVFQCINGGTIESAFKKAPDKAVIPCTFNFEVPSSGIPFKFYGTQTRNI